MVTHSFEDYLQEANGANTPRALFDVFIKTMSAYGYDKILFGLATDHNDIGIKAGIGIIQNYPNDWMKYYHEHSFHKIDPIITYGVHQIEAFAWSDISKRVKLRKAQLQCLDLSAEAGLYNGLTVPLKGNSNQIAGLSLASSEKKDACYFHADLLTAYCNHFYVAYKRLHQRNGIQQRNVILTAREKEVLTWAAVGKDNNDIGYALNISKHTVNMIFRTIYRKLEANNRTLAVVKAITAGLIAI